MRVVLGRGDGAGGGERGASGGGWGVNCSSGMKDNEVISSAWKCLLLWQISMLGGAFEQERAGKNKKRGRGGGSRGGGGGRVCKRFT